MSYRDNLSLAPKTRRSATPPLTSQASHSRSDTTPSANTIWYRGLWQHLASGWSDSKLRKATLTHLAHKESSVNLWLRKSNLEVNAKCGIPRLCDTDLSAFSPQQGKEQVLGHLQMTIRERKYQKPVKYKGKDVTNTHHSPYSLRTIIFRAKPGLMLLPLHVLQTNSSLTTPEECG